MKKFNFLFAETSATIKGLVIALLLLGGMSYQSFATICGSANVMSPTLPSTGTVMCGSTNDITGTNSPNGTFSASYKTGNEALYTFTPAASGTYVVSLSTVTTWTAIWVFSDCPTTTGTTLISAVTSSGGGTKTVNATLTGGTTYYIMFDTYSSPISVCATGPATYSVDLLTAPPCVTLSTPLDAAVTTTTPTLTWASTPSATSYDVYRGASAATATLVTNVTGTSYTTTPALTPGTYYWYVVPKNVSGSATGCSTNARSFIISSCVAPTALTTNTITATTAMLSWTAATPVPSGGYDYYVSTSSTAPTGSTVPTGNSATTTASLGPLTSGTTYYASVRSNCGGTSSLWVTTSFTTLTPGQVGTGTGINSNFPIYTCYGYNYSQQIYLASELLATIPVGNTYITKIRFNQTAAASTSANYNDWTVYMGNTAKTAFANSTDWVPAASMSQVFSGVLSTLSGPGWIEITLSNPFSWDGTSNIVIGVDENSPSYSCTASWASFTSGANRGILYYSDGTNPDPLSPPAANNGPTATIAQAQFVAIVPPPPNCVTAPTSPANNGGICYSTTPATLTWPAVPGATSYNVYLNSGATATTLMGNFTTNSYTTTAALATGPYSWKIVPVNAIGSATGCSTFSFTVFSLPSAPAAINTAQCGVQVPLASVSSTAGVNGTGTFNWYDAATAGNLLQGQAFGSTATTWYSDDYSNATPTATATLGGAAAISGGSLILQPTVTSSGGNIVIAASGANATMFNTDFDVTLNASGTTIADGFSYSFGDDVVGLTGATTPTAEKGSGSKLRLLFMTYNGSGNNAKGVYLVYNTNASDFTATANGVLGYSNNTSWIPTATGSQTSHISLSINAQGMATVMLGATPLFTNVQLPATYLAENKATWKHAISSRSGGIAGGFAIDNVILQKNVAIPGYTTYQQPVSTTTTFYVSETSPGGCESPRTPVTVTVNTPPTISVAVPATVCLGQSVTAVASSSNANYVYTWTPGTLTGASQSLAPVANTTYVVTANDMSTGLPFSGCATTKTFTVVVNPAPTNVLVAASMSTITCGDISMLTATGGTSPNMTILNENFNGATNTWTTVNNSTGGTPALAAWTLLPDATSIVFGTVHSNDSSQFYMTNSDAQGNGGTTATILQSPAFSTANFSSGAITLYQHYYSLGDSANVEASIDGTSWTLLKANTSSAGAPSAFAYDSIPLTAAFLNQPTVYVRFRYTSAWGYYWLIDNVRIKGDKKEARVWTPTTGLYTNAAATVPYTGTNADTVYAKPIANQTYTATATNTPGCSNSNTNNNVAIVVNGLAVNLGNDTTICSGQALTLNAGTTNSTYTKLWSNAATTQTINVTTAGTYTVTVSNGTCSKTDTIVVGVNASPVVNLGNDTAICAGQTLLLSAGAANSTFTKLWSNLATTQTIPVTTAGTYSVKVTNGTCFKSDTIVVSVNAIPVVNLGNDTAICAGQTLTLNAGTVNSTYTKLWSNLATTQTIPVTTAGTYSVKVTNGTCFKSDTIVVSVLASPVVNLGNDTAICAGQTLTLNAGAANTTYTKLWSNLATTQTIPVTTAGTYSVKVTNGTCSKSDTIVVSVNAIPVVNLGNDTAICAGQTLTLNAGTVNSTYTKLWSNLATTQTIPVTTAGTYSVKVTNGTCFKSDTIVVSVTALPDVNLGADTAICAGQTLTLNAGAANSTYTKLWSNAATTQTIAVTTAGTYSVLVSNGACSKSDSIVVSVTALPLVNLGADTSICAGTSLTLDAGNAGATYLWTGGTTAQTLAITTAGTYGVTVTKTGCMATDSIVVGVTALPIAGAITTTGTTPTFTFAANGATNVTTYSWTFGDGNSDNVASPTHTYAQTEVEQTFTVTLIVSNECGSDTVTTTVTVPGNTGVNNLQLNAKALKLYPNPAQQLVTVENDSKLTMKQIRITNILGQEVARIVVTNQAKQTINVANLVGGLYNVTIEFEEGSVNRKLEILK